jgi:hypothetical protein
LLDQMRTVVGARPGIIDVPDLGSHVMRTSAAVTGAGGIPVGYGTLVAVYLALAAGVVAGFFALLPDGLRLGHRHRRLGRGQQRRPGAHRRFALRAGRNL